MKKSMFALAVASVTAAFATDGTWVAGGSNAWGDTANWADGVIPDGGTATVDWSGTITLGTGNPSIAKLVSGGNGGLYLKDGLLTFTAPGEICITGGGLVQAVANTLSTTGDLTISGGGSYLEMLDSQNVGGRLIVTDGGWVRMNGPTSVGPQLSAYRADAIILDNGTLQNGQAGETVLDANRGITVTARGGYLEAGYHNAVLKVTPPVTGVGPLGVNYEFSAVEFLNPANAWQGDTSIGTLARGYNMNTLHVRLGADEVIPHGPDAGVLNLAPYTYNCNGSGNYRSHARASEAYLDMYGHTESVNALNGGIRACLATDAPARLNLVGDGTSNFRGEIRTGVTLAQNGAGTLDLSYGKVTDGATVEVNAGRVEIAPQNVTSGGKVVYNGGTLKLVPFGGLGCFHGTTSSDALEQIGSQGYPAWGGSNNAAAGSRYVYRTRWTLPEAHTYSFLKSFRGAATLVIDGATVIDDADPNAFVVVRDVALAAGDHTVDLTFAVAEAGTGNGTLFSGLMFDPENGNFETEEERNRARYFSGDFGDTFHARGLTAPFRGALHLNANCTLAVDPDYGPVILSGALSAANGAVLTVPAAAGEVLVGSEDATHAAVLDMSINALGGLVLTNNVWLHAAPAGGFTVAPATSFTLDYPGAFAGDLDLVDTSARLTTEGLGDGTITIHEGQSFRFDTQSIVDGAITDAATNTRTYANNIVLAGGTLYFAGEGTITYTGSITGQGTIEKQGGGTVLFQGNADALTSDTTIYCSAGRFLLGADGNLGAATIRTNTGRFGLPDGLTVTLARNKFEAKSGGFEIGRGAQLTITSFVEGISPVSLWGEGVLTLAGDGPDNTVRFHVRGGTLALAKSGTAAAVNWIQGIEPGATVKLAGDSTHPITDTLALTGGTFDLNGYNLAVTGLFDTTSGSGGTVVNNGAAAATLTIDDPANAVRTFSGNFAAGTAPLTVVKAGAGSLTLDGGKIANAAWQVDAGTAQFNGKGAVKAKYVRFRALASRPTGAYTNTGIQFSEIRFLLDGEVVTIPAGSTATAPIPAATSGENASKIIDGNTGSKWYAGDASLGNCVNTMEFAEPITFTAYQFATANDAPGRDPYSWTLEASDDGVAWRIVDEQAEVSLTEARRAWDEHVFAVKAKADMFAEGTSLAIAEGAKAVLSFVDETLEKLACAGTLGLANAAEVRLAGDSAITGQVAGTGTLTLAQGAATTPAFSTEAAVTVVAEGTDTAFTLDVAGARSVAGSLQDGTAQLAVTVDAAGAELTLGGTAATYTGPTTVAEGTLVVSGLLRAQYFRYTVNRRMNTEAGATMTTQLSRIDLVCAGETLAWPEGTTATTQNASDGKGEGAASLIDGNVNTKCFYGGGNAQPVVIACPAPVAFTGYDWYTANDSIQYNRQPISWTFEYSQDGVNWTLFDEVVDSTETPAVQNYALAYTYDTAAEGALASNAIGDASLVTVGEAGAFSLVGGEETVGGLAGAGAVTLAANGTLVFGTAEDAVFTGNIAGTGSLVMKGTGRQALAGAINLGGGEIVVASGVLDLAGATLAEVSRIVLKGGTLVGAASLEGDVEVVNAGGAYGAELDISGRLTLTGEMKLDAGFDKQVVHRAAFAYGSSDVASQQVFKEALLVDELPKGWLFSSFVSGRALKFSIAPAGTVLFLR